MIYGCQIGAVFISCKFEEGLERYKRLTQRLKLESIEFDFSHPELFTDSVRPRRLPTEIDASLSKQIIDFSKPYKIKGAHLPFGSMGIFYVSSDKKIEEKSKEITIEGIEKASELGLDYVTLHMDVSVNGITFDEYYERLKRVISEFADFAEDKDVAIAVETGEIYTISRLLRDIKSRSFKITVDVGHIFWQVWNSPYRNISRYIEEEFENIINIHLHDHDLQSDHLLIGSGVIDFEQIIKSLLKLNYKGSLTLEIAAKDDDEIAHSIEILRSYEKP